MKRGVVAVVSLILLIVGVAGEAGAMRGRRLERTASPTPGSELEDEETSGTVALPRGVRVVHDVAYGSGERQRFDVYLPAAAKNAPVIFMVHGGGWRRGDKASAGVVENKMARWVPHGFVFVSVNYPMVPDADPFEQAKDVARALATAQAKAPSWGADANGFILMGHSAGAHLVTLVATSAEIAREIHFSRPRGVVSLDSAAIDVERLMEARHFRLYDNAFGSDPSFWKKCSPMEQITRSAPPMLAVCSSRRANSCSVSESFAAKAKRLGVPVSVLPEDLSHREINVTLGEESAYTRAVERFLIEHAR